MIIKMTSNKWNVYIARFTNRFTVIQCSGVDAGSFLQNQFTCDISRIDQDDWGLAGYCSPKGRLLAIFFVLRQGDAFLLATHSSLAEDVIIGLRRFIMRVDVTLEFCPEKGLFVTFGIPDALGEG